MAGHSEATEGEDESEWRFSLSDIEERQADLADAEPPEDGEDEETGGSGVAGSFAPSETIEPGEIDHEHALFVLLGVGIGLAVVAVYVLALL
jgi:hypothetical protein